MNNKQYLPSLTFLRHLFREVLELWCENVIAGRFAENKMKAASPVTNLVPSSKSVIFFKSSERTRSDDPNYRLIMPFFVVMSNSVGNVDR